jgi:hypothetical protein
MMLATPWASGPRDHELRLGAAWAKPVALDDKAKQAAINAAKNGNRWYFRAIKNGSLLK